MTTMTMNARVVLMVIAFVLGCGEGAPPRIPESDRHATPPASARLRPDTDAQRVLVDTIIEDAGALSLGEDAPKAQKEELKAFIAELATAEQQELDALKSWWKRRFGDTPATPDARLLGNVANEVAHLEAMEAGPAWDRMFVQIIVLLHHEHDLALYRRAVQMGDRQLGRIAARAAERRELRKLNQSRSRRGRREHDRSFAYHQSRVSTKSTVVPLGVRRARSRASQFVRRMQPCDEV